MSNIFGKTFSSCQRQRSIPIDSSFCGGILKRRRTVLHQRLAHMGRSRRSDVSRRAGQPSPMNASRNHSTAATKRCLISHLLSPASLLFLMVATSTQTGCVALNIPSQRLHDPTDHGGMFGPWKRNARPGRLFKEIIVGPPAANDCVDVCGDDFYGVQDFDTEFPGHAEPTPEVPWPQYHPVPTRPVFGGAAVQ